MKVSVNWLKQFTDIDLAVDELVKKIGAQLGAVEEVIDIGKKYQGIVISKVVSCEKHPDADKLSVCLIDDGGVVKNVVRDKDGYVQVVCGAPNVRKGLTVAWLPPGATVPSSVDDNPFVLGARELRGVMSNGMIASGHELAINDDQDGIIELDSEFAPGTDFAEAYQLDDFIIDIENKMFTHRPDCFGILGVAREVAGITGTQFKSPDWYLTSNFKNQSSKTKTLPLEVVNESTRLCPRFMVVAMDDVEVKPSSLMIQTFLTRVGIKPINNIVDITNYLMVLTGQPLHAYDYDKLADNKKQNAKSIEVRASKKGESLKLLNGKTVTFDDNGTVLITAGDVPIGVGGVMGGSETEVDENTKRIVVECANFDMYTIRKTSMKYGLFTDAVTRFNKGQSPLQNNIVLHEAMAMVSSMSGGVVASDVMDEKAQLKTPIGVHVRADFINTRLGLDLEIEAIAQLLLNVEFDVQINGPTLVVTPPFWRTDIEIPEDVVEEIGRLYGYDKLPLELPKRRISPAVRNSLLELKDQVRHNLSRAGANEVLTYSFVHGDLLDKVGQDKQESFKLSNALSPDLQHYRQSLTPSILERVHANIKTGYGEFAMFELGKGHIKGLQDESEPEVPAEVQLVSMVFAADQKTHKSKYSGAAYYQALRYARELLSIFNIDYLLQPGEGLELSGNGEVQVWAPYEKSRSARITNKDGLNLGVVGEFSANVRRELKLPSFTAGFEIKLDVLKQAAQPGKYTALSKFPRVQQDMTLRVPSKATFEQVDAVVREALPTETEAEHRTITYEPLSVYQKKGDSQKNVSFRFSVVSHERTMVAQEVNKLLDEVAQEAKAKLGAKRV
ncbi:MAG: phenylalanine--tRNA ligase subunit beta [Candidatus Saccharibacteria bacterium]|nr:phenylalanine--tRNA ligase subunit beta [Candidatus Saccharibacteria bacterium]